MTGVQTCALPISQDVRVAHELRSARCCRIASAHSKSDRWLARSRPQRAESTRRADGPRPVECKDVLRELQAVPVCGRRAAKGVQLEHLCRQQVFFSPSIHTDSFINHPSVVSPKSATCPPRPRTSLPPYPGQRTTNRLSSRLRLTFRQRSPEPPWPSEVGRLRARRATALARHSPTRVSHPSKGARKPRLARARLAPTWTATTAALLSCQCWPGSARAAPPRSPGCSRRARPRLGATTTAAKVTIRNHQSCQRSDQKRSALQWFDQRCESASSRSRGRARRAKVHSCGPSALDHTF